MARPVAIRAAWPEPVAVHDAQEARAEIAWVVELISAVRTVRSEMNVPPFDQEPGMAEGCRP